LNSFDPEATARFDRPCVDAAAVTLRTVGKVVFAYRHPIAHVQTIFYILLKNFVIVVAKRHARQHI
jgi:hypothetical protein